jgi:hypothetical protein
MKIADHKLICAVLDDHMDSIESKIDEKILKTLQSDEFANKVAEKVRADVAETYIQLAASLKGIEGSIASINERLNKEEKKIEFEVKRLDLRINNKRDKIQELRDDYEKNKKHLQYLADIKPTLETIQKIFKFWTWKENKLKIIGTIAGFFIIIFGLFWIFLSITKGFIGMNEPKKITGIDSIEYNIKTGNVSPITRGATIHYTDAQRDSVINVNQHNIQMSIDKRDEEYKKLSETWKSKK